MKINNSNISSDKKRRWWIIVIIIAVLALIGVLKNSPMYSPTVEASQQDSIQQDSIEASQIIGYSVKKISGTHKYGGNTKIEYESLAQLIDNTTKRAEKEMWTEQELQNSIDGLKRNSVGGRISLYLERITLESALTQWFTIIIKDSTENEIFRERFGNKSNFPKMLDLYNYYNTDFCSIDKRLKTPFYVYIVESGTDAPFKFEVTAIKVPSDEQLTSNISTYKYNGVKIPKKTKMNLEKSFLDFLKNFTKDKETQIALINKPFRYSGYEEDDESVTGYGDVYLENWNEERIKKDWDFWENKYFIEGIKKIDGQEFIGTWYENKNTIIYEFGIPNSGYIQIFIFKKINDKWYLYEFRNWAD